MDLEKSKYEEELRTVFKAAEEAGGECRYRNSKFPGCKEVVTSSGKW
ncbi:MAG: hypothetical protein V5A72_02135 [Candidatus Nanohaloarchaea archaeon]